MEAFFDRIKAHPYLAAIIVFVIGAAIVLYFRSGSSTQSAPASSNMDSETAAATQLALGQNAAAAAQVQGQQQLSMQQESDATNLTVAQLAQQVQLNGQNLQADVINKQTFAGVTIAGYQAATDQLNINQTATTQQQQNLLTAQTSQLSSTLSAHVAENSINAQIQQAQIAAGVTTYTIGQAAQIQEEQQQSFERLQADANKIQLSEFNTAANVRLATTG